MRLHERNALEHGYTSHRYTYGVNVRECSVCGVREMYWDDEEYPINPCPDLEWQAHIARLEGRVWI